MQKDAKECLETAADLLSQATGCEKSVATQIVQLIALGTIRWQQGPSLVSGVASEAGIQHDGPLV